MSEVKEKFIMTPIHVTSCIVSALRQYFGSPERISSDTSLYLWDPDPKKTQVFIMEEFNETSLSMIGSTPAIFVGAPNGEFLKDAIADQVNFTEDTQSIKYFSRMAGNVKFSCVAQKALSSLELCSELKYFVGVFRRQIQCTYGLDYLRPFRMDGPVRSEEYKEFWTSSLTCDIIYQEGWTVYVEGLRIKSLDISLNPV